MKGRPTNHTKATGRCKKVGCYGCHEVPLNKSKDKAKGRTKRLASEIPSTQLLNDWRLNHASYVTPPFHGSKKKSRPSLKWDKYDTDWAADEDNYDQEEGAQEPGWALSISLLLDAALVRVQKSVAAQIDLQNANSGFEDYEIDEAGGPSFEDSDAENVEVPDFDAFRNEFEVFKSKIDAVYKHTSVAESEDSWWGVDLSEADEGSWEDDWSIVDAEAA